MQKSQVIYRAVRRVNMGDVDAAGIIYYASPLHWHEALFTEWLRAIGHPLSEIIASGAATPCVEATVKFKAPLLLDDEIELILQIDHVGRSSFILRSSVSKLSSMGLVEVRAVYVWSEFSEAGPIGAEPLPDWLRASLESTTEVPRLT